jgi:hypothetical protein
VPTPCQVTTIASRALTKGPEINRLVKWASSLPTDAACVPCDERHVTTD